MKNKHKIKKKKDLHRYYAQIIEENNIKYKQYTNKEKHDILRIE